MRKEIKIKNETVVISKERDGYIKVESEVGSILLRNQDVETVSGLIENNFNLVSKHYEEMIVLSDLAFDLKDIYNISMLIVLHYLYMYNSWRSTYKKQENKDLNFYINDFSSVTTYDIIFSYCKKRYPESWQLKCSVLLGMEIEKLKSVYREREHFYNK